MRGPRENQRTYVIMNFGEVLLWKKEHMKGPLGKLDSTWSRGIFLGVKGISDEKIIGTPEGIFKTRTTQRVPVEERWLPEASGCSLVT